MTKEGLSGVTFRKGLLHWPRHARQSAMFRFDTPGDEG
jgi:hypothetical protein